MSAFEFHGWATVRESFNEEGESKARLKEAMATIGSFLENDLGGTFKSQIYYTNGQVHLMTSGSSNHYRDSPLQLFKLIRDIAPGSYGLLHILDEEDRDGWDNHFQVWVLKRGSLERCRDTLLSPYFSEVEEL